MLDLGGELMDQEEMIDAIESNYPSENYTMLREALDYSIELLNKDMDKEVNANYKYPYPKLITYAGHCPECGALCREGQNYCKDCGQKIKIIIPNED